MISFASFPSTFEASTSTRHHPEVEDDIGMDLDEDDFEENVQRLTVPGEPITSSHAFMRYANPSNAYSRRDAHRHLEGTERL